MRREVRFSPPDLTVSPNTKSDMQQTPKKHKTPLTRGIFSSIFLELAIGLALY